MKYILILLTLFAFTANGQPGTARQYSADLYLEPTSFKKSIRIYNQYLDPNNPNNFCDTAEWGWSIGNNKVLTATTVFVNMGNEDAVFDNANPLCDTTSLAYHSCHGHTHIKAFQQFYLKDPCSNVVRASNKVGFNMGSNFAWPFRYQYNFLTGRFEYLNMTTAEEWAALIQYGAVDTFKANNNFDPYANADDYQVVDVFYGDAYSWSYRGQGVKIDGVPDGYYTFGCILTPPHCAINEGNNRYPNVVEVAIQIQGNAVTILDSLTYSQPLAPVNVDANQSGSEVIVTWGASGDYCQFEITPVYVSGNTERRLTNRKVVSYTNQTTFSAPQLIADARALGAGNGAVKYRFIVTAVNGSYHSIEAKSRQATNVR